MSKDRVLGDNPFAPKAPPKGDGHRDGAAAAPQADADQVTKQAKAPGAATAQTPRKRAPRAKGGGDTATDTLPGEALSGSRPPKTATRKNGQTAANGAAHARAENRTQSATLPEAEPQSPSRSESNLPHSMFLGADALPSPTADLAASGDVAPVVALAHRPPEVLVAQIDPMAEASPSRPSRSTLSLGLNLLRRMRRHLAMRDRSDVVDEFGFDPRYAAKVEPLMRFLYESYFRVQTQGIENIPATGRALLVANHSGTLPYDAAMIMYASRFEHPAQRPVRSLVDNSVFHFPYLGTFINRIGGVRACQENAERLLSQDRLVVVFPEGIKGIGKPFKLRYQLQRFGRGGFVRLALRLRAPIIPVGIVGAEETHPLIGKLSWLAESMGLPYIPITPTFPWLGPAGLLPLPTKWSLHVGKPMEFHQRYGPDSADDGLLVHRLTEEVRKQVQDLVDERLSHRRSVLLG